MASRWRSIPAELPGSVVLQQVTNGVAVRMAVLFELLGSGGELRSDDRRNAAMRSGR